MQIQQVYQLLQEGRLEQARQMCQLLIQQEPASAKARIVMSAIAQKLGDREAATGHLLSAAELQNGDIEAQLGIIRALRTIGALDEANLLLDGLDARSPQVAISRAQVQWQDGRYSEALSGFETAVEKWPHLPETLLALARALLRLMEQDKSERVLAQAATRWPSNPEISRLRAVLELDKGYPDQALQHLSPIVPFGPEATGAVRDLPQKMRAALQVICGQREPGAPESSDVLDRSLGWIHAQTSSTRWFGTNSALLAWAAEEIPDDLPSHAPVIECGVYHGFSLRLLANRTSRPIHGFDSFRGLPEAWKSGEPAGSYSTRGRVPEIAPHAQLHAGWFEDTLPGFATRLTAPIALLHVDCDLYSSTRTVLQHLGPLLAPGGLLVFDDFLSYEGYEQHEFRAAQEFFATSPHRFELCAAVLLGRAVAYRRLAE